jgi:purine-binding chemotaxis protein CheW
MTQEQSSDTERSEEIATFRLGDAGYGIPARYIREVQLLGNYTPLPFTPPFVVGLVNVRGRLLTMLDIRPLLEMPPAPPQPNAFLVVLSTSAIEVALLADLVIEVRPGDNHLAPMPSTAAGRGVAWARGVDRHLNLILDPPTLLADPRLIVDSVYR